MPNRYGYLSGCYERKRKRMLAMVFYLVLQFGECSKDGLILHFVVGEIFDEFFHLSYGKEIIIQHLIKNLSQGQDR